MKRFFSKKISKETQELVINDITYRVNIVIEQRKNSRVSITKTGINIRITNFVSKKEQKRQVSKFIDWAKKTIIEKEISFTKNQRSFKNGELLKVYDATFKIEILETETKQFKGKIIIDKIILRIPKNLSNEQKDEHKSKLISKLLVLHYKDRIRFKLHEFNDIHHFGEINNVRLKNNSTNWGSCSSKNNINISIRLLLAPEWVVDYVLIHELSHLIHRNHSTNFWKEVAKAYPRYLEAEKWLKLNSSKCII